MPAVLKLFARKNTGQKKGSNIEKTRLKNLPPDPLESFRDMGTDLSSNQILSIDSSEK